MDKRTFLALALCILILLVWQSMVRSPSKQAEKEVTKEGLAPLSPEVGEFAAPKEEITPAPSEEVVVNHPLFVAKFSTHGAGLSSFSLTQYRQSIKKDALPVELIPTRGASFLPYLLYSPDQQWRDLSTLPFKVIEQNEKRVVFQYSDSQRTVTKRFQFFPNRYDFDVETAIQVKGRPLPTQVGYLISEVTSISQKPSLLNPGTQEANFSVFSENKVTRTAFGKLTQPVEEQKPIDWLSFGSRYFVLALIPLDSSKVVDLKVSPVGKDLMVARYLVPSGPQQNDMILKAKGFIGPNLAEQLEKAGNQLEKVINWGWLKIFAAPLLKLLNLFYDYLHNYGLAIILLTILIKLLFYPLSQKSLRSMREMQRIQPQIQAIKERFKDDKEQLNKEMINIMKSNRVNPMGGCLHLLFQMPIFFALYRVLYNSVELFHAPFFGWIQDLSSKDPYFVTPILMGVLMVVQQAITPSTMDPQQKKVMMIMPVMFTFLMLFLPAGLNIYMLVNNILTIGQQWFFNRTSPSKIAGANVTT